MPNRILRDWTSSDKVDKVSFQAEVLFVRLMMKADDYGSFHANPKLINSFCFPLKNTRETDVTRWLQELVTAGLIVFYDADNKRYLNILDFGQRLRSMKKSFPLFDSNMRTNDSDLRPEVEEETETEVEEEETEMSGKPPPLDQDVKNSFTEKKEEKKKAGGRAEIFWPFSGEFRHAWGKWIKYKADQFKFKYKSHESEQAAINELVRMSGENEETACAIINQSIAKTWKGLFELKGKLNGTNQQTSNTVGQTMVFDKL